MDVLAFQPSATATNDVGVTHAEFCFDDVLRGGENTAQHSNACNSIRCATAPHVFSARAFDASGNNATSAGSISASTTSRRSPVSKQTFGGSSLASDAPFDGDGTIAPWDWNLGDGTSFTVANPSHIYTVAGAYNVTLTVTDDLETSHAELLACWFVAAGS